MNRELLDSSSDSVDATVPSPRPRAALSISITQRTLWTMVALVVAILGGIVLISQALGPIILLLLAIIFGEGIRPIVERLERYRIPPPLAIYLVLAVVAGAFLWLLLSPLLTELGSLIQRLPDYQLELQEQLSSLHLQLKEQGATGQALDNMASSLAATIQQSAPALVAVPFTFLSGIFGLFVDLVIVMTMTLFWLLGSRSFKRFLVGLLPLNAQANASAVIAEVGLAFGPTLMNSTKAQDRWTAPRSNIMTPAKDTRAGGSMSTDLES